MAGTTSGIDVGQPPLVSVDEAAARLGRDRSRIYALIRSGELTAVRIADGALLVDRASLERWAVASRQRAGRGRLLTPRNAWAVIGLASGDAPLRERCLGLLDRPDDWSRARERGATDGLLALAPRLRRRALATVLQLPPALLADIDGDASLVRTGISAARAYGWDELGRNHPWVLDAYLPVEALHALQGRFGALDVGGETRPVLLRAIDASWPFPPHAQLAPQPLAALDLLEYPDATARHRGRQVLAELAAVSPAVVARRSARGRARAGALVGRLLAGTPPREAPPSIEGDPRTDTRAAAAHIVGVLWSSARDGATVRELRQAIGLTRERFEAAYEYLLAHPPLGLSLVRDRDALHLTSAGAVATSVERHRGQPRPVALSHAALEALAIVAFRQPVTQAGIEHIRGTGSDSALGSLLQRGLIAVDEHRLFTTTPIFLQYMGIRDLADLPPLPDTDDQEHSSLLGFR